MSIIKRIIGIIKYPLKIFCIKKMIIEEIATLGNNVYDNYKLDIESHK